MSLLELLSNSTEGRAAASRIYGVVIGIVTNNQDEDNLGRVKVRFPWLASDDESHWARIANLMGGSERGSFFLPEVDDEVLVAFEHGIVSRPYILGGLWNGVDLPPETNEDGKNNLRLIKSRSGHVVLLDDTDGEEKIEVVDKTGNNKITIDVKTNTISITTDKDIELKASKGKIVLDAKEIEINSSTSTKLEAGSTMDVKSSATMDIKGATVNIN